MVRLFLQQMRSLDERPIQEFEDESPCSPEADARKIHPMHEAQPRSFSGGSEGCGIKRVCKSLKVVVFTNKLNLLMPVGPAAILVHKLTGHNVSCKFWLLFVLCSQGLSLSQVMTI